MYALIVRGEFSAAHRLPGSGGRCERLHGHNWRVEVRVLAEELDETGMALDFHLLKEWLREVLGELDHRFLNDLPPFRRENPTAENIARFVYERIASRLPEGRVSMDRVVVWESEETAAVYMRGPGERMPGGRGSG